jgi:hypothetical protein
LANCSKAEPLWPQRQRRGAGGEKIKIGNAEVIKIQTHEGNLRLFKYVPPERIDILENEKIAFTPPDRFKDPFEFRLGITRGTARSQLKDLMTQIERHADLSKVAHYPHFQVLPECCHPFLRMRVKLKLAGNGRMRRRKDAGVRIILPSMR